MTLQVFGVNQVVVKAYATHAFLLIILYLEYAVGNALVLLRSAFSNRLGFVELEIEVLNTWLQAQVFFFVALIFLVI